MRTLERLVAGVLAFCVTCGAISEVWCVVSFVTEDAGGIYSFEEVNTEAKTLVWPMMRTIKSVNREWRGGRLMEVYEFDPGRLTCVRAVPYNNDSTPAFKAGDFVRLTLGLPELDELISNTCTEVRQIEAIENPPAVPEKDIGRISTTSL